MPRASEGANPPLLRFRFMGLPTRWLAALAPTRLMAAPSSVESSPQRGNQDPPASGLALWPMEITRVLRSDIMRF
jgi:hypothetical protein